jgi:hypothetical protein
VVRHGMHIIPPLSMVSRLDPGQESRATDQRGFND